MFCSLSIRSKEWTNRKFLVCRKWWGLSRWHCLLRFERHYSRKTSEEVVDRSEGEDTATFASLGSVLLSTCQRSSPEKQSIVRLRIYSVERLSLSLWSRSMLDGSLSDQSIPWSSAISYPIRMRKWFDLLPFGGYNLVSRTLLSPLLTTAALYKRLHASSNAVMNDMLLIQDVYIPLSYPFMFHITKTESTLCGKEHRRSTINDDRFRCLDASSFLEIVISQWQKGNEVVGRTNEQTRWTKDVLCGELLLQRTNGRPLMTFNGMNKWKSNGIPTMLGEISITKLFTPNHWISVFTLIFIFVVQVRFIVRILLSFIREY